MNPSWCRVWLRVSATPGDAAGAEQLAAFRGKLLGRDDLPPGGAEGWPPRQLDLRPLYPPPPRVGPAGSDAQTVWVYKHYSTFSEFRDVRASLDTPTALHVHGLTKCTPPLSWTLHVAGRYPRLDFQLEYCERRAGLIGTMGVRGPGGTSAITKVQTNLPFADFDAFVRRDGCGAAAAGIEIADWFLDWGADDSCGDSDDDGAHRPKERCPGCMLIAALEAVEAAFHAALGEACGRRGAAGEAPMGAVRAALGAAAPPPRAGCCLGTALAEAGSVQAGARVAAGAILREAARPWQGETAMEEAGAIGAVLDRVRDHLGC
jgi:hypothetical protein